MAENSTAQGFQSGWSAMCPDCKVLRPEACAFHSPATPRSPLLCTDPRCEHLRDWHRLGVGSCLECACLGFRDDEDEPDALPTYSQMVARWGDASD